MKSFIVLILFFSCSLFGQENDIAQFRELLKKLATVTPPTYLDEIPPVKTKIESLLEKKRRICVGEYSTLVFQNKESKEDDTVNILNKEEKILCLKQLKQDQEMYFHELFLARKRLYEYLYKVKTEALEAGHKSINQEVDEAFNKAINEIKKKKGI